MPRNRLRETGGQESTQQPSTVTSCNDMDGIDRVKKTPRTGHSAEFRNDTGLAIRIQENSRTNPGRSVESRRWRARRLVRHILRLLGSTFQRNTRHDHDHLVELARICIRQSRGLRQPVSLLHQARVYQQRAAEQNSGKLSDIGESG
jgi:hypothetical protein